MEDLKLKTIERFEKEPNISMLLLAYSSFCLLQKRLCPLKCVTPENAVNLVNIINDIHSGGGTNI